MQLCIFIYFLLIKLHQEFVFQNEKNNMNIK